MTEIFGGDSRSIRIIKECLDTKLEGRNHIDAQVSYFFIFNINYHFVQFIDQIQKEIKLRIGGANSNVRSSRNLIDHNLGRSANKRKSLDVGVVDNGNDRFSQVRQQNERGQMHTNPVPSVMLYSHDNINFASQADSPSNKLWSPRGRISNAQALAAKFKNHDTSPDVRSPAKNSGTVSQSRKSLPVDQM